MTAAISELRGVHNDLQAFADSMESSYIAEPLNRLEDSANEVAKAWSGSWFGYHALVYYVGLIPPPPGAHFSSEWGLDQVFGMGTTGDWQEYDFDGVRNEVMRRAGSPDLTVARQRAKSGEKLFEEKREEIVSILESYISNRKDKFLERLLEQVKEKQTFSAAQFVEYFRPTGSFMSRDSLAMTQGFWTPPHISVLADVLAIRSSAKACADLAKIVKQMDSHISRTERQEGQSDRIGTNVFIGHGRSKVWMELKDFIQDRLRLPWDEFNRVPVAGVTNITRLSEMLDAAAIAFIVMTAEDELADGKLQARMNVVHEAGLFQGRLGFTKAIVLLEEGCQEFSNINGLGQIRFPKGRISAAFEEIRQVLEREGLIDSK